MKITYTQPETKDLLPPTVRFIAAGTLFRSSKTPDGRLSVCLFVKLKPTGFLLNSSLVADILNRGDCLVHNLQSGTVHAMQGSMFARVYEGSVVVTDQAEEEKD